MIAEVTALLFTAGLTGVSGNQVSLTMYRPADRSVSNWRLESVRHLDLDATNTITILSGREPARLPRCVKLNNYWCIKSARWNGEIATDNEGHVAFASANEGAAVAVALLRRYYLEFGRKSALSIVTRWAPAQCGFMATAPRGARKGAAPSRANGLATKGLGNTLRARFLASRGRASVKGRRPVIRSVVPDRPIPMMRAPSIAAGMGEREMKISAVSLAALGPIGGSGSSIGPGMPRTSCSGDSVRIRNYATSIIQGLVKTVDDDLKLFEPDGMPAPNLARAMVNMAAVEIGPYRAAPQLIDRVVANAVRTAENKRTQESLAKEKLAKETEER